MAHLGSAATDLCFFLCSSTTTNYRKSHWDSIIKFYYQEFCQNVLLLVDKKEAKIPSFEEFMMDIRASIPISIFFCANLRDLDTSTDNTAMDYDPFYGQEKAKKESIQDLHESFGRLQNSYSLYFMRDPEMTSIHENVDDEDDDEDEDDDDEGMNEFGFRIENSSLMLPA